MFGGRRWWLALPVLVVLFCVALTVVGAFYAPNTQIPAGFAGKQVDVDGLPLRVVQSGSGRDVLLIHGSPGSVEDWEPVVRALPDGFRVTRFDRPGHGYSGDDGQYGYEHNAAVALSLIQRLGLERVIVVGHSYGGTTALALALMGSPLVAGTVVIDSATYTPSRQGDLGMRLLDVPLFGYGFATVVAPLFAPQRIRRGLAEQFRGGPPAEGYLEDRVRLWSAPKVTHAVAAETLGAAANLKALSPRYPGIHGAVFILAEADNDFRRTTAEHLHSDVAGSSLRLLAGTGHNIQFEKTAEVVETIQQAAAH